MVVPPSIGDNIIIPHVSLLASGYEPESLRSSGMTSPPVRTQETSMVPQLDGPGSVPSRNPAQERMGRPPDKMEQDPSKGGTYEKKTAVSRRSEYPNRGGPLEEDTWWSTP